MEAGERRSLRVCSRSEQLMIYERIKLLLCSATTRSDGMFPWVDQCSLTRVCSDGPVSEQLGNQDVFWIRIWIWNRQVEGNARMENEGTFSSALGGNGVCPRPERKTRFYRLRPRNRSQGSHFGNPAMGPLGVVDQKPEYIWCRRVSICHHKNFKLLLPKTGFGLCFESLKWRSSKSSENTPTGNHHLENLAKYKKFQTYVCLKFDLLSQCKIPSVYLEFCRTR